MFSVLGKKQNRLTPLPLEERRPNRDLIMDLYSNIIFELYSLAGIVFLTRRRFKKLSRKLKLVKEVDTGDNSRKRWKKYVLGLALGQT